ncbi:hypothetical protein BLD25_02835 [Candidatus Gracilibacteria bacterium GN02-872]|nr:hypothetical protein BLD25_02835 [Candidatus Gracilibacteria bacterium GN02-872]
MKNNVIIKYFGGIESDNKKSPNFVSLTGSSTLVDINGFLGLIDYGMFQGGKNDEKYNQEPFELAEKLDFVVLTHAHLDHCGRLPFLVKSGFSGPIYTTRLTGLQTKEMLFDYVRIMKAEIDKSKNLNKKVSKKFKQCEFLVRAYESLNSNKLSREDREKIEKKLYRKFPEIDSNELNLAYLEAKDYLSKNKESDYLRKVDDLLFDESDVERTFSLFKFVDNGEEITVKENISFFTSEVSIEKLFSLGVDKNEEKVYLSVEIFNKIVEEIGQRIENTKKALKENLEISKRNDKIKSEYLSNENIDLEDSLEDYYEIPYSIEQLKNLKNNLSPKVDFKDELDSPLIKAIKLRFFSAGHIEGSSQVLLQIVTETAKRVLGVLNKEIPGFKRKTEKTTNLLFSGDLGRISDPNLPGIPAKIPFKLDYAQVESTYAGRNHEKREEMEKVFFEELENANGKVLIPAFSIQRTQEVLLMILNEMKKRISDLKEYKERKKELKKLKETLLETVIDSKKAINISKAIEILQKEILGLKKSVIFQNIIVDSPLSKVITNIYRNDKNINEKYKLLDPAEQIRVFGRQVIHFLEGKKDQEKIYIENKKNSKEIIVSAAGMCEGGSILFHLQNILEDKDAKIVFVGYCPESTNGGKIKARKEIFIEGKKFQVLCELADLKGFSAHIDGNELLEYLGNLDFAFGAKLALNHGGEARKDFAEQILTLDKIHSKVNILVPDLFDEVSINIKK